MAMAQKSGIVGLPCNCQALDIYDLQVENFHRHLSVSYIVIHL